MQISPKPKTPANNLPTTSEAELRLSLRQSIEARDIADGHVRDAKEVADKSRSPGAPGR